MDTITTTPRKFECDSCGAPYTLELQPHEEQMCYDSEETDAGTCPLCQHGDLRPVFSAWRKEARR